MTSSGRPEAVYYVIFGDNVEIIEKDRLYKFCFTISHRFRVIYRNDFVTTTSGYAVHPLLICPLNFR